MTAWLMCVILKKLLHFIRTGAGCTASMVGTVKGSKSDPNPVTTSLPVPDKECALFCFQELLSYQMTFWSSGIADQLKGLKKNSSAILKKQLFLSFPISPPVLPTEPLIWAGPCRGLAGELQKQTDSLPVMFLQAVEMELFPFFL